MPSASATAAIVLAVYMPPQAPSPGQIARSTRSTSSRVILPARQAPTASKASMIVTSLPSTWPGMIEPAYRKTLARSSRAAAISMPGRDLSQPASSTEPSRRSAIITVSTESAITSRETSEKCMPSWPIEIPSETEIVPNSSGYPPAACTPFFTAFASRSRERLHGRDLVPARRDADLWLRPVVVAHADGTEHAAGRCLLEAVGDVARARLDVGLVAHARETTSARAGPCVEVSSRERRRSGSVRAWIRSVARSTISRAAGERVAFARCTTAIVSYCLGLSGTHPASGANRGNSCLAAPLGMTESATTAADQLHRGLDVLDLDPGRRVEPGLVHHPAQHDPGRVDRPPGGLGHHHRRPRQLRSRHRRAEPLRVRAHVDELVARHRDDLHPLTADLGYGDHGRLDPSAAQVLHHVDRVLPHQLDPDVRMSRQHLGNQVGTRIEARGAEHAEPDRAGLQRGDTHRSPRRLVRGRDGALVRAAASPRPTGWAPRLGRPG